MTQIMYTRTRFYKTGLVDIEGADMIASMFRPTTTRERYADMAELHGGITGKIIAVFAGETVTQNIYITKKKDGYYRITVDEGCYYDNKYTYKSIYLCDKFDKEVYKLLESEARRDMGYIITM